jgi:hypothetical protein
MLGDKRAVLQAPIPRLPPVMKSVFSASVIHGPLIAIGQHVCVRHSGELKRRHVEGIAWKVRQTTQSENISEYRDCRYRRRSLSASSATFM